MTYFYYDKRAQFPSHTTENATQPDFILVR